MGTPNQNARIYLSPPHMSGHELENIHDAFESNWIAPLGPHVDAFEKEFAEYIGVPYAAALSSGTAALHLALELLNISADDEVVCPSLTFCATANVILYQRAHPVFLDSEERSWNLDPELLEEELKTCAKQGRLPKAVISVDLYGQCADYSRIERICSEYDVPLIEDAAEALGATFGKSKAGTFGLFGVFSFNGNKIITTSGGGMLVSSEKTSIDKARFLATQARDPAPHYQHSTIGYNYRLSNILAAIGRGQLQVLDQRVEARRKNFEHYFGRLKQISGIQFLPELQGGRSTRWLTCILIDPHLFGADREQVRLALEKENIESRPVWKPLHMQPVFRGCKMRGGKVAEHVFERGLCLPSGSNLTPSNLDRIVDVIAAVQHR